MSGKNLPATGGQFRGYRAFSGIFIVSISRIFRFQDLEISAYFISISFSRFRDLDLQLSGSRFQDHDLHISGSQSSSQSHPDFMISDLISSDLLDFRKYADFGRFQSLCKVFVKYGHFWHFFMLPRTLISANEWEKLTSHRGSVPGL